MALFKNYLISRPNTLIPHVLSAQFNICFFAMLHMQEMHLTAWGMHTVSFGWQTLNVKKAVYRSQWKTLIWFCSAVHPEGNDTPAGTLSAGSYQQDICSSLQVCTDLLTGAFKLFAVDVWVPEVGLKYRFKVLYWLCCVVLGRFYALVCCLSVSMLTSPLKVWKLGGRRIFAPLRPCGQIFIKPHNPLTVLAAFLLQSGCSLKHCYYLLPSNCTWRVFFSESHYQWRGCVGPLRVSVWSCAWGREITGVGTAETRIPICKRKNTHVVDFQGSYVMSGYMSTEWNFSRRHVRTDSRRGRMLLPSKQSWLGLDRSERRPESGSEPPQTSAHCQTCWIQYKVYKREIRADRLWEQWARRRKWKLQKNNIIMTL